MSAWVVKDMYDEAHLSTPCSYRHAVLEKFCSYNIWFTLFVNQEWFYVPRVTSASEYREISWALLGEAHHQQHSERVHSDLRCYTTSPFSNVGHFDIIRTLRSVVKHQPPLIFETHICCGWDGWQGMPRSSLSCRWQEILTLALKKRSSSTPFWVILLFS